MSGRNRVFGFRQGIDLTNRATPLLTHQITKPSIPTPGLTKGLPYFFPETFLIFIRVRFKIIAVLQGFQGSFFLR